MHRTLPRMICVALAVAVPRIASATDVARRITDDTFLDSTYSVITRSGATVVTNTQNTPSDSDTTPGGKSMTPANQRVKVVINNGSSQNPGNSRVHGLLKLPQQFWSDYHAGLIQSATIGFRMFNNSLNAGFAANDQLDVELHPMTSTWDTATATWRNFDNLNGGNDVWSGVSTSTDHEEPGAGPGGGEYDAARFVKTVDPNVAAETYVTWNITPFFSDPVAMNELETNGVLLKVDKETLPFDGNRFYSLYSANLNDGTGPVVTETLVPEPAAGVLMLGAVGGGLLRRRRGRSA